MILGRGTNTGCSEWKIRSLAAYGAARMSTFAIDFSVLTSRLMRLLSRLTSHDEPSK